MIQMKGVAANVQPSKENRQILGKITPFNPQISSYNLFCILCLRIIVSVLCALRDKCSTKYTHTYIISYFAKISNIYPC